MEKEFHNKYMKHKFPGLTGPLKKTKKYNSIDYTQAYALINEYKRNIQMANLPDVSISKEVDVMSNVIVHQKQEVLEVKKQVIEEQQKQIQQYEANNKNPNFIEMDYVSPITLVEPTTPVKAMIPFVSTTLSTSSINISSINLQLNVSASPSQKKPFDTYLRESFMGSLKLGTSPSACGGYKVMI